MSLKISIITIILAVGMSGQSCNQKTTQQSGESEYQNWSVEKASAWYSEQDWIVGANFTPSTAINQIEFWHGETCDSVTIDKELGYTAAIGFNTMRLCFLC